MSVFTRVFVCVVECEIVAKYFIVCELAAIFPEVGRF